MEDLERVIKCYPIFDNHCHPPSRAFVENLHSLFSESVSKTDSQRKMIESTVAYRRGIRVLKNLLQTDDLNAFRKKFSNVSEYTRFLLKKCNYGGSSINFNLFKPCFLSNRYLR